MMTKYIKWTPEAGFDPAELEEAARIVREGGLVSFPTETVYGLGANGLVPEAARSIYEAKGRPSDNPLILHIAELGQLDGIVSRVPDIAKKLADVFWPGPLTMIFEKAACVPYDTTGGLDTVAVRMPAHEGALAFLKAASVPVAAPSANVSGRPSPTRAEHVKEDLDGRIDMVIDGGRVGIGLESTIVDLTGEVPVILRPGAITRQMLSDVVGEVVTDPALMSAAPHAKPKAPGMKYRHYAPQAKMIVFRGNQMEMADQINKKLWEYCSDGVSRPEEVGILATEETAGLYPAGQVVTAGSREKGTVGKFIYGTLRTFDELGVKLILSESFYGMEQEEAIMNRLLKAASTEMEKSNRKADSMDYDKVIFVSKENISLSPMAEWIFKSILMDKSKEIVSRGLVVLFPEPRNMKVSDVLINHGIPHEDQVSVAFSSEEVTEGTLILTMNFIEKVKVLEDFGIEDNVYTINEFAGEEGEVLENHGNEDTYEASYVEIKDLLYKIKKKLQWT